MENWLAGRFLGARPIGPAGPPHRAPVSSQVWNILPKTLQKAAARSVHILSRARTGNFGAAAFLLAYAVIWATSAFLRNLAIPLHGDMLEAFALSRTLSLGYLKHPPLINWITAAWFSVFPVRAWAFYLLALLNASAGMWFTWLVANRIVDSRRRIVAVSLLGLTPIFTVHAATFNHNGLQLSLWPLVALTFLLSIERKSLLWSVLFGLASGLAIIGKYYAGLMVVACLPAAFFYPGGRRYLSSFRPYLAAMTCCFFLAPHLYWLWQHEFVSVAYQIEIQPHFTPTGLAGKSLLSLASFIAFLMPAAIGLWISAKPNWHSGALHSICRDWPAKRAALACLAITPVALPLFVMPMFGIAVASPWSYPGFYLFPLLVVSAPRLTITRTAAAKSLLLAAVTACVAVVISPLLSFVNFLFAEPSHAKPFEPLAEYATELWHRQAGGRLEHVFGSSHAAWAVTFYSPDHPSLLPSPGQFISQEEIVKRWKENGVLGICAVEEPACNGYFNALLPRAQRETKSFEMVLFGFRRLPQSYVFYLQPKLPP